MRVQLGAEHGPDYFLFTLWKPITVSLKMRNQEVKDIYIQAVQTLYQII